MVLSNFVYNGNPQQLHILADNQVIDIMIKQLECKNNRTIVAKVLQCFSKLIPYGIKYTEKLNSANTSLNHLLTTNGTKKFEKLQRRGNKVSKEARRGAAAFVTTLYKSNDPLRDLGMHTYL